MSPINLDRLAELLERDDSWASTLAEDECEELFGLMAALCRQVMEAPEVAVGMCEDECMTWVGSEFKLVKSVYAEDIEAPDSLAGKRVRLVEVP